MKFLKPYKLFENVMDVKLLMTTPTFNMKENYAKINSSIDNVSYAFGLPACKELLKEIAMVETRLGTLPGSIRYTGTAGRGPWQIDEIAYKDIMSRGRREYKQLFDKFKSKTGIDLNSVTWNDCNQFLIGCVFARLVLYNRGIKNDILDRADRADIWKKHYNTIAGKGTPQKYWETVSDTLKTLAIKDPLIDISYNDYLKEKELLAAQDTEVKIDIQNPDITTAKVDSTYVAKKPITPTKTPVNNGKNFKITKPDIKITKPDITTTKADSTQVAKKPPFR
jgi:hypothetical protein